MTTSILATRPNQEHSKLFTARQVIQQLPMDLTWMNIEYALGIISIWTACHMCHIKTHSGAVSIPGGSSQFARHSVHLYLIAGSPRVKSRLDCFQTSHHRPRQHDYHSSVPNNSSPSQALCEPVVYPADASQQWTHPPSWYAVVAIQATGGAGGTSAPLYFSCR